MEADEVLKAGKANRPKGGGPPNGRGGGRGGDCCSARTCITSPSWGRLPKEPVDAAVRRASPGAQHHDRRASGHPDADADWRATCAVHANGKTVRPLGQESDKALALLNALDDKQRKQAMLTTGWRIWCWARAGRKDDTARRAEGSAMNEKQRAMLLDVMAEWAGIIHEVRQRPAWRRSKASLNDTWFAWSGPTTGARGKQHHGVLPDSGTASGDRVCAATDWAAIRRCTFTRCTEIPPTITGGRPRHR